LSSLRVRSLSVVALFALALAGCGGSNAPSSPLQPQPVQPQPVNNGASSMGTMGGNTVPAVLSATSTTYSLPLSGGYKATISLHSNSVPAGTKMLLGVQQPQMATVSRLHGLSRTRNCPSTLTIPLFNPFSFAIVLNVDGFSLTLPCNVNGALFGVSFFQLQPVPAIASSTKVGDITAVGRSITFSSDVATITLPPRTETALAIVPESSTSEVAIPLAISGGTAALTSNAGKFPPSPPPSLTLTYNSGGGNGAGSGTLFSSGCDPAFPDPTHPNVIASPLAGVPILGVPQFYCTLGTVNSSTVTFGTSNVTFSIGAPLPDRSFIGLDGPSGEFACGDPSSGTTACTTTAFAVPTVQNVIVGNVQDMQSCLPVTAETNCNSNAGAPAPATTAAPRNSEVDILVADDPTYTANTSPTCAAPQICGGFALSMTGPCSIDNGVDENGDVPPGYTDPSGPQENPPVSGGYSTSAIFPAQGPFTEFDIFTYGAGTCAITVTETDGPAQPLRSTTLSLQVGAAPAVRVRSNKPH
jgi:hypothetical protein